ncbi:MULTISPECIES: septal ring lytic transglycosylase RlpA family protein [unclassified Campylobacter]|uniref:septal ring lytic transglycosylase RlpA family protein n=1 Tax=unclassified Campylobacter TaxID=2593542 RepID=UPI00201D4422|nr:MULTISPECIES: septal ring lytic transglycosylase RlpA family protein [unclassified Campylobacter]QKG28958.1 rare lipoprotein A [Campylobacter sp. RM16187]
MLLQNSIKFGLLAIFVSIFFTGCSWIGINFGPTGPTNVKINNSKGVHQATMRPYTINGKTYYPTIVSVGDRASGIASWYGPNFHGKKTSNGEIYNMYNMTAAHKTLPMNTMVRVTNLKNGKNIIVRINDRGPFVAGRVIDLSKVGAQKIDMIASGTAPVVLEVVGFNGSINSKVANIPSSQKPKVSSRVQQDTFVGGIFMVQIGAFRNLSGANAYKRTHSARNYNTQIKEYILDGRAIYRVFLVGFRSENEARDFIEAGHIEGAFIARE